MAYNPDLGYDTALGARVGVVLHTLKERGDQRLTEILSLIEEECGKEVLDIIREGDYENKTLVDRAEIDRANKIISCHVEGKYPDLWAIIQKTHPELD